ncbi:hypothetical protein KSS87_016189 [Heliosperma pusillum]|nr:hypothetical protein KSS87_016189 [Heliosperma pusillum]
MEKEMVVPFMGVMIPESPSMDLKFELHTQANSPLLVEMSIPWNLNEMLGLVSRSYLSSLPVVPVNMSDRIPNLTPNTNPISCLVWNIQGSSNRAKIAALKEVIKTYKPSVVALLETRMGGDQAIKIGNILGFDGHARVNAAGFSGGIWVYWRTDFVSVQPITEHEQYITMEISRRGETPWFFSAVYASHNPSNRKELWKELEEFARINKQPWLMAGDFNETRSIQERHGGDANMARRCNLFNNWIENCELIELAFTGPSHTWARGNSPETRQSARMDRALCNSDWSTMFSDGSVKHLPAIQSDNCPLLISPNGFAPLSNILRPFRFQAAWLTHEKFIEFINDNWEDDGDLVPQLKRLSIKLQDWNHTVFGNIFLKKSLKARIEGCQKKLSLRQDRGLIKLEAKLRKEFDDVLEQEEILWYQKSRMEFIRDGDRNTSYFHVSTLVRRWRNKINSLKDDNGDWCTDPDSLKQIAVEFYKKLYTEESSEISSDLMPYDLVTRATFAHLEEKFNKRLAGWSTKHLSLAGRATLRSMARKGGGEERRATDDEAMGGRRRRRAVEIIRIRNEIYFDKGVNYVRSNIEASVDKRLSLWEQYCLRHCFALPSGFTLPHENEASGGDAMDQDDFSDEQMDAQLELLRSKLAEAGKECSQLNKELEELETKSALTNRCASAVNEALQLYDNSSAQEVFQEMLRVASELRQKMDQLKAKQKEDMEHNQLERADIATGGLSNLKSDTLQEFIAEMNL